MKGCLITVVIIVVLLAGGGLFVWVNRDEIMTEAKQKFELPKYGKKEYIENKYSDLLRSLDTAANNGSSIMTFGAAVEGLTLPEEVLYVGINKGENKTDVIKRFAWSSISRIIMFGYGSGTLGKAGVSKKIIIYENNGPWDYMDSFVVFIEYTGGMEESPSG